LAVEPKEGKARRSGAGFFLRAFLPAPNCRKQRAALRLPRRRQGSGLVCSEPLQGDEMTPNSSFHPTCAKSRAILWPLRSAAVAYYRA
jgi:hypothetical protein